MLIMKEAIVCIMGNEKTVGLIARGLSSRRKGGDVFVLKEHQLSGVWPRQDTKGLSQLRHVYWGCGLYGVLSN